MIVHNGNIVVNNGRWIIPPPPPPIRTVYLIQTTGGTISAQPLTGYDGTIVTLSNISDYGYDFNSYSVSGSTLYNTNKFNLNGSDVYVTGKFDVNYNPLNLPPYTIRILYDDGIVLDYPNSTFVQVSTSPNIWDITHNDSDWFGALSAAYHSDVNNHALEVLGANTSGVTSMLGLFNTFINLRKVALFDTSNVTNMSNMFYDCYSLTTIPLFDTSKVTNMSNMFYYCTSLESVPLLDTGVVRDMETMFYNCTSLKHIPLFNTIAGPNMNYTFYNCKNVESGALALYRQASSQGAMRITEHNATFRNCGSDTTTGAAELAQIASDWK